MPEKAKAAPRGRRGASKTVGVGQRNRHKNTPPTDKRQAIAEREIYSGRDFVGVVREVADGSFVAVFDEQIIGAFATCREATDKLLDLARPRAEP